MDEPLKFKTKAPLPPIPMTSRDQKVWDILADSDDDAEALAKKFDVSHQTIRNVKMGKTNTAKRLANLMERLGHVAYVWTPARRFTAEEVATIRSNTKASHVVAKQYNCSPSTIRMIKSGQTYKGD
jgi:Mor family transcriptional regulator